MSNPAPVFARLSANTTRFRLRLLLDRVTRLLIGLGGVSVIIAITLIFFYLLYVVVPMFASADSEYVADYGLPGDAHSETLWLSLEEQREVGARISADGRLTLFQAADGTVVKAIPLPLPADSRISVVAAGTGGQGMVAVGLDNGAALILRLRYRSRYDGERRVIEPQLEFPFGEQALEVDEAGEALARIVVQGDQEVTTLAATTGDGRLLLLNLTAETSLLDDEISLDIRRGEIALGTQRADFVLLGKGRRYLYVADRDGWLSWYEVRDLEAPQVLQRLRLLQGNHRLTALEFLTGDISLLVGASDGELSQWFPVRDAGNNQLLQRIRSFEPATAAITALLPEPRRKGFLAVDGLGRLHVYHSTANRELLVTDVEHQPVVSAALAPRADGVLVQDGQGRMHLLHLHNEHPEVSWSVLWGEVWYESYAAPGYVWQSSASSNDFEPKFSLMPLAFGTLKAAFYAMLFAVPLAVMGAIYTAYFMAPRMRAMVKPGIEIMEALPTVILGFLAGLWLAPLCEEYLAAIFLLLLILPLGSLAFAYLWHRAPMALRQRVPEGWDAALLMPVICLLVWLAFLLGGPIETALFGGDLPAWLSHELGIDFDQRNALIVGLAMGFAVIPTIFSLAEDAIFSVPRHLRNGSLALGATQWQTLVRVILLTASPGIFAAIMIGLGRAVGETMIVLMATGNTPVMDFSIFQGMRTLSANIAVEMPESEVDSTHYRILFLSALVLFVFTLLFNTAGELVRQRLRRKYSNL